MTAIEEGDCGTYMLLPLKRNTLCELPDGSLELLAEGRYLVRFGTGADRDVLRGALEPLGKSNDGLLRFGNFIGSAELGTRNLRVRSKRLSSGQVDGMLDDIERIAAALPFAPGTPVLAPYERKDLRGPDILYQSYVHLRDGMRGVGPHDLPAAVERVLARPHEELQRGSPMPSPVGAVDRVDADVFVGILTRPERLRTVASAGPAAGSSVAARLGGRLPDYIDLRPVRSSYDTAANRFVLMLLDTGRDVARRFIAAAKRKRSPALAANVSEAERYTHRLESWRRHRTFDGLTPAATFPFESTVLRGRAGYRELTRWYTDLLARSRRAIDPGIGRLLELRDAAEIYEQWCFYQVVDSVTRALGRLPVLDALRTDEWVVRVPWGCCADFGNVQVEFNRSYSRPCTEQPEIGSHSYSVRLRPDITVRGPGGLHLLDAKLKRDVRASFQADDTESSDQEATFTKADLYKMHAYRDALGAASVWILYPGDPATLDAFPAVWDAVETPTGPQGVGALALIPGEDQETLDELLTQILGPVPEIAIAE